MDFSCLLLSIYFSFIKEYYWDNNLVLSELFSINLTNSGLKYVLPFEPM